MYSLPTSTTLAALTMASAASMAPTSPLVSTMPSASMDIARESSTLTLRAPIRYRSRVCPTSSRAHISVLTGDPAMQLGRPGRRALVAALAAVALVPTSNACRRRKPAEVNAIVPSFTVNRPRAPLGSAVEVTYSWNVEPSAKKLAKDYQALVHFLDSHGVMLFDDDHRPTPPTTAWEPGKSYSYTQTKFIPIYPYVGESEVRMGLYRDRERAALKGEDAGMEEYKVGK